MNAACARNPIFGLPCLIPTGQKDALWLEGFVRLVEYGEGKRRETERDGETQRIAHVIYRRLYCLIPLLPKRTFALLRRINKLSSLVNWHARRPGAQSARLVLNPSLYLSQVASQTTVSCQPVFPLLVHPPQATSSGTHCSIHPPYIQLHHTGLRTHMLSPSQGAARFGLAVQVELSNLRSIPTYLHVMLLCPPRQTSFLQPRNGNLQSPEQKPLLGALHLAKTSTSHMMRPRPVNPVLTG